MDFEAINEQAGGCGLYHYVAFFLLALPTFKQALDLQGLTFALYEPIFWCDKSWLDSASSNGTFMGTVSRDQCSYRLSNVSTWNACTKWIYDNRTFRSSMITEMNLVCSRKYIRDIIFSIHFVGELIGFPIVVLSDRVGRRLILMTSLYISIPVTLMQALTYNAWMQVVFTFIGGAIRSISIGLAYTTLVELMSINSIEIAATNFFIFYSFGYMATAAFAYFSRTWRMISLLSLVPTVAYLFYFCFIPETPRWLMLRGEKEKSFKTMSFIARINRREISRKDFDKWNPLQEATGRIWLLFRYRVMVVRCLILTFVAWAFSFAYIASSTDLTFASSNIFLTTLVMGIVEVPTGPLAAVVATHLGRKNGITILCCLGILGLTIMPFIEDDSTKSSWQPWFKVGLAMGAKLGFTSAWCVFDVIINELIPTTVRNGGMGIIYTSVCLGGLLAPMLHEYATEWHYAAPCLIYSSFLIITVVLVMAFLPETKNMPLPQTMEEAAALTKNKEQEWKKNMIADAIQRGLSDFEEEKF